MHNRLSRSVAIASVVATVVLASALQLRADDPEQFSDWSTPINLGSTVNTASGDFFPFISRDGLSLYMTINNLPGGYGGWDIYVCQRVSIDGPWGAPQNLGPTVNTSYNEGSVGLSPDGHLMFFSSDRPGGFGGNDIYVSRRQDKRDDFAWQAPENLGGSADGLTGVNTPANESSPDVFEDDATGVVTLYLDSNRLGGFGPFTDDAQHNGNDIYTSTLQSDGTFGPAAFVSELSSLSFDRQPSVRRDGLEIFFASNRSGSLTDQFGVPTMDVWVSTRSSTSEPWSAPVDVPVINSGNVSPFSGTDAGPALSFDGTTLYFQSNRPGVVGNFDLYMSTRTKLKQ